MMLLVSCQWLCMTVPQLLTPYSVGATCFNLVSANNEAYVCNTFGGELASKETLE